MRALMLAFALLCTCSVAYAAPETRGIADADFTAKYFGTTAVLHAASQVVDPNTGWWGELLPPELSNNPGYLIGIINARRMDAKSEPLLDPSDPSLIVANAELNDEHGWTYTIDFYDMRPSEVEALLNMLGGPGKVLKGASSVSYEPLKHRYLYASAMGSDPVVLNIAGRKVEIPQGASMDQLKTLVGDALRSAFDQDVPFDVTLTMSSYMDGSRSYDLSVNADMEYVPGTPVGDEEMSGE